MLDAVIDLYHGDSVKDWSQVHGVGVLGVIHKASQGTVFRDNRYEARRTQAKAAGIPHWGAYHFATAGDGKAQANLFLDAARPDDKTLMALDIEHNPGIGGTTDYTQCMAFIQEVQKRTGRLPYVYGSDLVKEMAAKHKGTILTQCPLWLAQYGGKYQLPVGWPKLVLWQYAENGHVDGIAGGCDRSKFEGTPEQLAAVWATGK